MYTLVLWEKRAKLARLLRKRGFYVRIHAYEYLIGCNNRLIGLLLLEPYNGEAFLKIFNDNDSDREEIIKKIKKCIYDIDKMIKIYII